MQRSWSWLDTRLCGPHSAAWLALIAVLFSLPALRLPFEMDDHWLRANLALGEAPSDLMGGIEPGMVAQHKAEGSLAWWAHDALHVHFLRPLTSLTHYADFALWGQRPLPMHVLNIALYAVLAALAALTYRALANVSGALGSVTDGAAVVVLAGLMFALDDAHAPSTGWISGRNTLLAAVFALASLYAYARAHAGSSHAGKLQTLSALALGLGLLAGESGLSGAAYLAAFALCLDARPWAQRCRSLAPHALVVACWAAYYATHGYGAHGSDWYRDPLREPLDSALGALADLPLWLGSALVASFATPSLFANATASCALWLAALACVAPLLLHACRRSALARFYAAAMLLCLVPLLLTRPQDRLLLCTSFGAFGLLAIAIADIAPSRYRRVAGRVLKGLHLGLAPLLYLAMLGQAEPIERSSRALASLLTQDRSVREIVVVSLPVEPLLNYARALRLAQDEPLPAHTPLLYAGGAALHITRVDERTLELLAEPGMLSSPFERVFTTLRSQRSAPSVRRVGDLRIEVLELDTRGAPKRVRFTFDSTLSDPTRAFITWSGQRPVPWTPPPVGQTVAMAPLSALRSLTPR